MIRRLLVRQPLVGVVALLTGRNLLTGLADSIERHPAGKGKK